MKLLAPAQTSHVLSVTYFVSDIFVIFMFIRIYFVVRHLERYHSFTDVYSKKDIYSSLRFRTRWPIYIEIRDRSQSNKGYSLLVLNLYFDSRLDFKNVGVAIWIYNWYWYYGHARLWIRNMACCYYFHNCWLWWHLSSHNRRPNHLRHNCFLGYIHYLSVSFGYLPSV